MPLFCTRSPFGALPKGGHQQAPSVLLDGVTLLLPPSEFLSLREACRPRLLALSLLHSLGGTQDLGRAEPGGLSAVAAWRPPGPLGHAGAAEAEAGVVEDGRVVLARLTGWGLQVRA